MNIMAGATVGGGTRVNWAVSFKTPLHVRKEWAEINGLPNFMSLRYEQAMDAVCKRLGVKNGVALLSPTPVVFREDWAILQLLIMFSLDF